MTSWISSFLSRVESRIGVVPMIYTNVNWWNPCTGNSAAFSHYLLDISSCASSPPSVPGWGNRWTFWQYDIPGCGGTVHDLDVYNGNLAGLAALAGGSGRSSPLLAYDSGTSTILYRWASTGSSFSGLSTATWGSFDLDRVGGRIASGDVDGDGTDDTVMAYQNGDGTFSFKVLLHGTSSPVTWYTSGPFSQGPVGDRLIVGDFNGDGRAEPILGYDGGTSTILYRWYSTGSSFGSLSTATYGSLDLDNVGSRMAVGDVNGDGIDDIVIDYQNSDTTFTYKVFLNGTIAPVDWYTSGPFNQNPVHKLLLGHWL
jgi:hypothetical protein